MYPRRLSLRLISSVEETIHHATWFLAFFLSLWVLYFVRLKIEKAAKRSRLARFHRARGYVGGSVFAIRPRDDAPRLADRRLAEVIRDQGNMGRCSPTLLPWNAA